MSCRCGHGRMWHRASSNASSKRRRLGLRPTGNLPCSFRMMARRSTVTNRWGGWAQPGGKRDGGICRCRNYVPAQEAAR